MPDLGFRDNVMGPQPIAERRPIPQEVIDLVARILTLLAEGKSNELIAMAVDNAQDEVAKLSAAVKPNLYRGKDIVATARTNQHFWIKAKLTAPDTKPFTLQLRLGPDGDRLRIWQATNLSDARSAWTK